MKFLPGDLIHVYNRGNNKQQVFFSENNYQYFIHKAKSEIGNVSDVLAYCLMPNHFHFLLHVNEVSCRPKKIGSITSTELQNGFRILQSSYANAINKELGRSGSVFQQNTKFKLLSDSVSENTFEGTYAEVCFNYIHQNPVKAKLVSKLEDWNFSSFKEYMMYSRSVQVGDDNKLCNKELAFRLLRIKPEEFYKLSNNAIRPELIEYIF